MCGQSRILISIDAPHYNAGLVHYNGVVVKAAPIIGWTIGKNWLNVKNYFVRKGYTMEEMKI